MEGWGSGFLFTSIRRRKRIVHLALQLLKLPAQLGDTLGVRWVGRQVFRLPGIGSKIKQ